MNRQVKEVATRVYSYGCVPARIAPVLNSPGALAQMRLGQRLWNTLVAIERARIEGYRRLMRNSVQERIDELRESLATLRDEIKMLRKAARKRAVDLGDRPQRIAAAKLEIGPLIEGQKATAPERREARRAELTALQERANRRIKRARQAAAAMGLFWGSYNDIVQRADAGRKHGGELHFRGFHGEGTLTAQIMGGAAAARCVGGAHTFFQVDAPTPGQKWRYARIRIGSDANRGPVWTGIPIVYHRDVPPGATIKSVSITRRRKDNDFRWSLNITVTTVLPEPKAQGGRAIAFDLGWRLREDGIRVAYWIDREGNQSEVLVPHLDLEVYAKNKKLQSICDRNRDEFLPALAAWMEGQRLPDAWRERSAHLAQWKSSDRLAGLVMWWRLNRLDSDAEIFEAATDWRRQYLHLSHWLRNASEKMRLRLRERYRVFAAGVARDYDTVVVEALDLRELAREPKPEEEGREGWTGNSRQRVGPSVFRGALLNACKREGLRLIEVPAEYTTRACHQCGKLNQWDQTELMRRCDGCGELWDQDANAAANLLRIGLEDGNTALQSAG